MMNRRGFISGMCVGAGLFAGGQLIAMSIKAACKKPSAWGFDPKRFTAEGLRYARYIGGRLDGTIHTLGPEVKLGSTIRVPVPTTLKVIPQSEYPFKWPKQYYAHYRLHTITTVKPGWGDNKRGDVEWVWIFNPKHQA